MSNGERGPRPPRALQPARAQPQREHNLIKPIINNIPASGQSWHKQPAEPPYVYDAVLRKRPSIRTR